MKKILLVATACCYLGIAMASEQVYFEIRADDVTAITMDPTDKTGFSGTAGNPVFEGEGTPGVFTSYSLADLSDIDTLTTMPAGLGHVFGVIKHANYAYVMTQGLDVGQTGQWGFELIKLNAADPATTMSEVDSLLLPYSGFRRMVVTEDGQKIVIALAGGEISGSKEVIVVDTATMTEELSIDFGFGANANGVATRGSLVAVALSDIAHTASQIRILNLHDLSLVGGISLGQFAFGVNFVPGQDRLLVGTRTRIISVDISTVSNPVIETFITLTGTVPVWGVYGGAWPHIFTARHTADRQPTTFTKYLYNSDPLGITEVEVLPIEGLVKAYHFTQWQDPDGTLIGTVKDLVVSPALMPKGETPPGSIQEWWFFPAGTTSSVSDWQMYE
jgi:hypothetical protein